MRRLFILACGVLITLIAAWWLVPAPPTPTATALPRATGRAVAAAADAGWRDVRCPLPAATEGEEVVAAVLYHRDAAQVAIVEQGGIVLVLPPGDLIVLLDVPGLETVQAAVDPTGACALSSPPPQKVTVTAMVRFPSGRVSPDAMIIGCGSRMLWLATDPLLHYTLSEPCEIRALVGDEMSQVSERIWIDPAAGDREVDFSLPWEEPAGLNLSVAKRGDGFVVRTVGGLTAEVLAVGDVIVAVDGRPAADLTVTDFIALDAGPPESSVALRIRPVDGPERDVRVARERATH